MAPLTSGLPEAPTDDPPLLATAVGLVDRRLAPLPDLLRRAEQKWERDAEHVHRLRVATRRADAALAAFRPLFNPRRVRKMRRRLRTLRRAARTARACDVHLAMLEVHGPDTAPGIAEAIRLTRRDRRSAQKSIARVASRQTPRRMKRRLRRVVATGRVAGRSDLAGLGRDHLASRARAARTAAAADLAIPANLHRLRIAMKKLRYGLEIFGPYSDLPLRETLIPHVKAAGDRLGRINDVHELADRLSRYADRRKVVDAVGLSGLAETFRTEGQSGYAEFSTWWKEFEASGVLERLESTTHPPDPAE